MSIRKFALGAVSAAVMAVMPMAAQAAVIQLGFILDRSGSIGDDFAIMRSGLSQALGLLPVDGASMNTYEISVVSFASTAAININKRHVTTAAERTQLQADILSALPASGSGTTNYEAAFTTMATALAGSTNSPTKSYVNFGTDGDPVGSTSTDCVADPGFNPPTGYNFAANRCGFNARNALIAAGVDNISIEGIDVSADSALNLQRNYCYPGPCEIGSATLFDTRGFYFGVANAAGYAATLQNKIKIVTGQVPEPATLALVGLALAGLGFGARRKSA